MILIPFFAIHNRAYFELAFSSWILNPARWIKVCARKCFDTSEDLKNIMKIMIYWAE